MSTPRIAKLTWGRAELEDGRIFKDVKLFPGGARAWDWNETGTRHAPGIQLADAEELIDAGAEIVVLSRGMDLVLEVPLETVRAIEARGVEVRVAESREAAKLASDLAGEGRKVGALIHSTC